jgi:hypothetical protein
MEVGASRVEWATNSTDPGFGACGALLVKNKGMFGNKIATGNKKSKRNKNGKRNKSGKVMYTGG